MRNHLTTDLLKLKIFPISSLVLHEEIEPARVERLRQQLQINFVLRNPPVVTPLQPNNPETKVMVLDGATRTTALQQLGYQYIVAQIVDYRNGVYLGSWHHLLSNAQPNRFYQQLASRFPIRQLSLEEALELLERRAIACYCSFPDRRIIGIETDGNLLTLANRLRALVALYAEYHPIHRLASEELEQIIEHQRPQTIVIVFPTFTPDEIVTIVQSGCCLPTGITRHLITGRALNLNFPLEILRTPSSLEEKNQWLDQWLTKKILNNKVRFYPESVFVFDE